MSIETIGISLTIAATIISVYNTVLFYRQSRLQEKQTLLQRSQIYPFVKAQELKFKQNVISLRLKNMTETSPAYQLGLLVNFIPLKGIVKDQWVFSETITVPEFKSGKGYSTQTVVPLKNKRKSDRLYGQESEIFTAEPMFIFKDTRRQSLMGGIGSSWHYDNYPDLKRRLIAQDIGFVAVMFALVYKDAAETVNEFESIGDFVIILNKHNSLQEASEEAIPFHQKTVGLCDMPAIDLDMYNRLKSYRSRLDWLKE
jgi:hypothetical protein